MTDPVPEPEIDPRGISCLPFILGGIALLIFAGFVISAVGSGEPEACDRARQALIASNNDRYSEMQQEAFERTYVTQQAMCKRG